MDNAQNESGDKRKSFNKETTFHDTHLMQCYVENFFGGDSTKLRPKTDVKNIANLVTFLKGNPNLILKFYNYFLLSPGTTQDNPKNLETFIRSFTSSIERFILQNQCRSCLFIFNGDIESSNFMMFNHASKALVNKFAPLNVQKAYDNFIFILDKMTTLRISETKYLRRMSYVVQTKISNNVTRPGCIITIEPILFDRSALNQFKFSSNSKNILTFEIFSIYKEMISSHAALKVPAKLKPQAFQTANIKNFNDTQTARTSIFDEVMKFIGMSKDKTAKILTTVLTLSFCTSDSLAEVYLEQAAMLLETEYNTLKSFVMFSVGDPNMSLCQKMDILAQDIYYSLLQTMVLKFNKACSRSLNCPWSMKFFVVPSYCDLEKFPEIVCINSFYQMLFNFNDIFSKCLSEEIIKSRSSSIKKSRGIFKLDQPVHYEADYEFLQKLLAPNNSIYRNFLKGTHDKGLPTLVQSNITYKLANQPVINRFGDLKKFLNKFKRLSIFEAIDAECLSGHISVFSSNQLVSNLVMPFYSQLDTKTPTFGDHYFGELINTFNENYNNFSNIFCTVDPNTAGDTNERSLNLVASMIGSLFNSDYNYQTFKEFRRNFNNQISHLVSLKYLKESVVNADSITEDTINAIVESLSTRYSISKADLGLTIERASSSSHQWLIKIKTFTYIIFPEIAPCVSEDSQNSSTGLANGTGDENNGTEQQFTWVNPNYIVKDKKKAVQIFKAKVEEQIKDLGPEIQNKLTIALTKYERERVNKIKSNSSSEIYYAMFINIARSELRKSKSLTDDEISAILKPINSIYLLKPKISKNGSGTVSGHEISPITVDFGACFNCGNVFKREGFSCKVCNHTFCSQCYMRIGYDCKKSSATAQISFSKIPTYYQSIAFSYSGRTFKISKIIITLIQMVEKFESKSISLYRKESTKLAMMEFLAPYLLHYGRSDSFKYHEYDPEDSTFATNSLVAATALKYLIASSETPIISPAILSDLVEEFVKENGNKAKLMPQFKHMVETKLDRDKKDCLTLVMLHLNKLMGRSSQNQVTYESMGVCFAPVFSPAQALDSSDPVAFGKLVNNQAKVFEILVEAFK